MCMLGILPIPVALVAKSCSTATATDRVATILLERSNINTLILTLMFCILFLSLSLSLSLPPSVPVTIYIHACAWTGLQDNRVVRLCSETVVQLHAGLFKFAIRHPWSFAVVAPSTGVTDERPVRLGPSPLKILLHLYHRSVASLTTGRLFPELLLSRLSLLGPVIFLLFQRLLIRSILTKLFLVSYIEILQTPTRWLVLRDRGIPTVHRSNVVYTHTRARVSIRPTSSISTPTTT